MIISNNVHDKVTNNARSALSNVMILNKSVPRIFQ